MSPLCSQQPFSVPERAHYGKKLKIFFQNFISIALCSFSSNFHSLFRNGIRTSTAQTPAWRQFIIHKQSSCSTFWEYAMWLWIDSDDVRTRKLMSTEHVFRLKDMQDRVVKKDSDRQCSRDNSIPRLSKIRFEVLTRIDNDICRMCASVRGT